MSNTLTKGFNTFVPIEKIKKKFKTDNTDKPPVIEYENNTINIPDRLPVNENIKPIYNKKVEYTLPPQMNNIIPPHVHNNMHNNMHPSMNNMHPSMNNMHPSANNMQQMMPNNIPMHNNIPPPSMHNNNIPPPMNKVREKQGIPSLPKFDEDVMSLINNINNN